MPVSYQLMRASSGDTLDFEGEVDMLKYGVVSVFIKVLHQPGRAFGIAIVTDRCYLCDGLNGIGCLLNQCNLHYYSPCIFELMIYVNVGECAIEFDLIMIRICCCPRNIFDYINYILVEIDVVFLILIRSRHTSHYQLVR